MHYCSQGRFYLWWLLWKSTVLVPIRGCVDNALRDVWQCLRCWRQLRLGTGVGGVVLLFLSFYSGCRSLLCLLKGFWWRLNPLRLRQVLLCGEI